MTESNVENSQRFVYIHEDAMIHDTETDLYCGLMDRSLAKKLTDELNAGTADPIFNDPYVWDKLEAWGDLEKFRPFLSDTPGG